MREADGPWRVFRVGRGEPWQWPDWAHAGPGGLFDGRYDDPLGIYRVMYASSERLGAFLEALGSLRPDPSVLAGLKEIVGEPEDVEPVAGELDRGWLGVRHIGEGLLAGRFADIGHHESLAEVRTALSSRAVHYGLADVDAAAIRLTVPRGFTQELSRYVYDLTEAGRRAWDGIAYRSRFGDNLHNWAMFEPTRPTSGSGEAIAPDDPDLLGALRIHGLVLSDP